MQENEKTGKALHDEVKQPWLSPNWEAKGSRARLPSVQGGQRMEQSVRIRRVMVGDEKRLAYIQTESWKEAFREIVPADILAKCTDIGRATEMYKQLLEENKGNGYILELEEKPHCMAWWDAARDRDMDGFAELICIHSLKDNWRKGYGKMMMKKVLDDVKRAGYSKIMLWVFDNNIRAIRFYEAFGFAASGRKKPSLGTMEEMYIKTV